MSGSVKLKKQGKKPSKLTGATKKKSAKKGAPTEAQLHAREKAKFHRAVRTFFDRLGFSRLHTDGKEFVFKGRTGELDDVFIIDNVVVVAEYTVGNAGTEHVAKKKLLWDLIGKNEAEWIDKLAEISPAFKDSYESAPYQSTDYKVRVCYFSKGAVSDEIVSLLKQYRFLDETKFRYFDALAKTIHRSARFEFYKYLSLNFSDIGPQSHSSHSLVREFSGHLLPEGNSSFPKGFKIVSFYADPSALLTMSYVLRRDSWQDPEGTYQRVLMKGRMTEMRKYLISEKRVFVNNIIVTLPPDTALNEIVNKQKNLSADDQKKVKGVSVSIPYRSDVLGIVDGQHRVFCYHEGVDSYEDEIKKVRERQNLLVTGLIYPDSYTETQRQRFEAKLFLEINDKQKRTKSELKQSIELILNPYSNVSIAKRVVQRLNESGALRGMLQTNYFDPPRLIRTTSVVSYGLRPVVKLDDQAPTIYKQWSNKSKAALREAQKAGARSTEADELLRLYVEYCASSINTLLIPARKKLGSSRWVLSDKAKDREITPTLINGFLICLKLVIADERALTQQEVEVIFQSLDAFNFSKFKSSRWSALGEKLYRDYFA